MNVSISAINFDFELTSSLPDVQIYLYEEISNPIVATVDLDSSDRTQDRETLSYIYIAIPGKWISAEINSKR